MTDAARTYRQAMAEAGARLREASVENEQAESWFLLEYAGGMSRSEYYLNKSVFYRLTRHLAADLVIAAIITVIVMVILVSMQKSHMEAGAASYADRRSVQMRRSQDIYLRTTVIHRQAPKNTGGGGGPHGSGSFTGGGGNFGSSSGRF